MADRSATDEDLKDFPTLLVCFGERPRGGSMATYHEPHEPELDEADDDEETPWTIHFVVPIDVAPTSPLEPEEEDAPGRAGARLALAREGVSDALLRLAPRDGENR